MTAADNHLNNNNFEMKLKKNMEEFVFEEI